MHDWDIRSKEATSGVARGGGVLERKSDPTQERSDPPISVAACANYCSRGSSMRYIKRMLAR